MDLLASGLICVAIAATNFMVTSSASVPAYLVPLTHGLLAVLGLYLIVAGIARRLQERHEAQLAAPLSQRNEVLKQTQAPDLQAREEKMRQLQTKLEAALAENKTLRDRPANVEAEIVSFLSLLQQKGRFIDFLMDDITPYADAQVGAAARVVHQGCGAVLREYLEIHPVREDSEGSAITLDGNYQPGRFRLVGKVVGSPPFKGVLVHRGWVASKVTLPRLLNDMPDVPRDIIAPAEVELR